MVEIVRLHAARHVLLPVLTSEAAGQLKKEGNLSELYSAINELRHGGLRNTSIAEGRQDIIKLLCQHRCHADGRLSPASCRNGLLPFTAALGQRRTPNDGRARSQTSRASDSYRAPS